MGSSEERNVLENLNDLMATDLHERDDEALLSGYHDAVAAADIAGDACRQILAVLRDRHSWSKLVALTGDPQSTLYNRANPRRVPRTAVEQEQQNDADQERDR